MNATISNITEKYEQNFQDSTENDNLQDVMLSAGLSSAWIGAMKGVDGFLMYDDFYRMTDGMLATCTVVF